MNIMTGIVGGQVQFLRKCEMIGCRNKIAGTIQLGPGTLLAICMKHLNELQEELGRGE